MGDSVRLRVVFEDAGILCGSQRRRGLQKCWLQLRPDIVTIADLVAHLHVTFGLHSSCPRGLIISMDGFVLPSFESICILKDEDVIMIKKNGVMFQDAVKFSGSHSQGQVIQSKKTSAFNNRNLVIMDPQEDSQGDGKDMVIETPPSKNMNENGKRKRSNKLQGSNNTLASKISQRDSLGDEETVDLHRNKAHKETTSNETVKAKRKRKQSNEFQTTEDFQADTPIDKDDLGLPIPHKETSSSEMIKQSIKGKHFDKFQGSDDTLAIKDSQGYPLTEEEDDSLHEKIAHEEATSNEMMYAKYKRKHSDKPRDYNSLRIKNSRGDSHVDEGDLCIPNGKTTHQETSCELKNAKNKGKHSNKPQGSDDTSAIKDFHGCSNYDEENIGLHGDIASLRTTSYEMMNAKCKKHHTNKHHASEYCQGVSPGDEKENGLPNGNIEPTETPSEITSLIKRKHSIKSQPSENESKGNGDGLASKNDVSEDVRKVISRSARRKKAKKLWYRTFGSKKEKKLIKNEIENEILEGGKKKKPSEHANADQNTTVDEEIVPVTNVDKELVPVIVRPDKEIGPVIVRPGHIRFESSDMGSVRADQPVETFQWNGTISKKKGQKWGRENTSNKWNNDTSNWLSYGESSNATEAEVIKVSNEKAAVENVNACEESNVNQVEPVKECNENSVAKEFESVKELLDFESFSPLVRLPEEGDVLTYRMVELSSSGCPELSPFRVGKVSSYDCSSSNIILLPLPEYPIMLEEISEEWQENWSLYKEDGTLEVDLASLVDVRLFKAAESIKKTPSAIQIEELQSVVPVNNQEMQNVAPVNNHESTSCSSNRIEISSNHTENNQFSGDWEAINQALEEKKSQLQKQKDLDERKSSLTATTTGVWSYKALRRNALGPTLAMLRTGNGDSDR